MTQLYQNWRDREVPKGEGQVMTRGVTTIT
jgi:hypothetical protein